MKPAIIIIATIIVASSAVADTVVASRTIRAKEVILSSDLKLIADDIAGMASRPEEVAGFEAKRILYSGRPIALSDIGPVAVVDRNQIVPLAFKVNGLTIKTEGRALGRGGSGDRIRVINLDSKTTVTGKVDQTGTVWVGE